MTTNGLHPVGSLSAALAEAEHDLAAAEAGWRATLPAIAQAIRARTEAHKVRLAARQRVERLQGEIRQVGAMLAWAPELAVLIPEAEQELALAQDAAKGLRAERFRLERWAGRVFNDLGGDSVVGPASDAQRALAGSKLVNVERELASAEEHEQQAMARVGALHMLRDDAVAGRRGGDAGERELDRVAASRERRSVGRARLLERLGN